VVVDAFPSRTAKFDAGRSEVIDERQGKSQSEGQMDRVLVLYYSQSGEVAEIASLFATEFSRTGAEVTIEQLNPETAYPYPWRSIRRFFDAMPESVLGLPPAIRDPGFDPTSRFRLVVFAYPVWFLSPALPVQAFFRLPHAEVLRDTETVTITVSRAMWQTASERMKVHLASAGAVHCDNVVVTHQGSPLLTLVSTPRALLFGRKDSLLGVFPKAGVADSERARVRGLAAVMAQRLRSDRSFGGSLLSGEPALTITRWLVVPELLASYCFYRSAVAIRAVGKINLALRALGVYAFAVFLLMLILIGLPLAIAGTALASLGMRGRLDAYVKRLSKPTGSNQTKPDRVVHRT